MTTLLDKFSMLAMAVGVAMMLQPWWADGFRVGFFVTLGSTALQIVVGHIPRSTGVSPVPK